ncbi:sodium:solute symporter [Actinomadura graeca]|uniref:Sodium:solute symporter n=1 Tax=Actinomadura graeca TaxID=2750812 RepID=A0ABX8QUJ0_9ACTN|nr:sodium:solute symporter [Actinomadura graeca]QXJ22412.1 sodium:solute symporter [Actinomadura graeca]
MKWTELTILVVAFTLVTVMGFAASRWRRADDPEHLDEWGLGGRDFGSWLSWFLIGGDFYTAYTFVSVPALLFATGAAGFFPLPYSIIVYPMVLLVLPRLWEVARRHGHVTTADFVRARHGSGTLALLVALTGIVATMPYIALQLVGIQAVLKATGVHGEWPIVIAFAVLAAYTYRSGLRAPALIAFVKDALIFVVVLAAVIYVPMRLGGWDAVFDAADRKYAGTPGTADGTVLGASAGLGYSTLALGSAAALFLYPHSVTGVLAAGDRGAVRRTTAALPAYSLLLGLLALLGYMAIAAGVQPMTSDGRPDPNTVVPLLYDKMFPNWFAGIAFTAIGVSALVPAAIMSIAAANLFTRNVYKEYLRRDASPAAEARAARVTSLTVKAGAVAVIVLLDPQFSIDLQLIGGVIVLQTLPSVLLGLCSRAPHRWALIAGWTAGMASGLWMLYVTPAVEAATGRVVHAHWGGAQFALDRLGLSTGLTVYAGVLAVLVNLAVTFLLTPVMRRVGVPDGEDLTAPDPAPVAHPLPR